MTIAERAAADSPRNQARLLTLGAALYRAHRYQDAVRKLNEAAKVSANEGSAREWLFLAMAHYRESGKAAASSHV